MYEDLLSDLKFMADTGLGCNIDSYEASQYYYALNDLLHPFTYVEQGTPQRDGWYLVYAPSYSGGSSSGLKNIDGMMFCKWAHGKWSIEVGYHKRPGCVKAWMPIPRPDSKGQFGGGGSSEID